MSVVINVHDRFQGQDGLTRPSWNVQPDKDGGSQMLRVSKKFIKLPIIATASKVKWGGMPKVSPYLIS
jgi:hypothetical protein